MDGEVIFVETLSENDATELLEATRLFGAKAELTIH
jgi:hypothetical protein